MPRARFLTSVLTTVSLTACTVVGPDFSTPEVRFAEAWQDTDAPGLTPGDAPLTDWWKGFNDPVLDSLINEAHSSNLGLEIAGLRIYEARAALGRVTGRLYPQTGAVGARAARVQRSDNADPVSTLPTSVGNATDTDFNDYTLGAGASWELDFWGRYQRDVEAADANLSAAVAAYDASMVSLTGDVAAAYVLLRTLQERHAFTHANIALQKRALATAQQRFRDRARTELDVQQAVALLNATQARIPSLDADIRRTKNALSTFLARPPGELSAILGGVGAIPTGPDHLDVGIPADLLRRRPDVRRAAFETARQSARIGIAEADLYPAFRLGGSIGFAAESTGDLFDGDSFQSVGAFSVMWKLLNRTRLKNEVRVQDARFQQRVARYQLTVLTAAQEVEDALIGYLKTREQVSFREAASAASQRAAELALSQYRNGRVSFVVVLEALDRLARDQDRLTTARGDAARHLISAYKALGGGWENPPQGPYVSDAARTAMQDRTDWGDLLEASAP